MPDAPQLAELVDWKNATANLKWGQQRAFITALNLVAEGKTTMSYSSDYGDGGPCLVNTIDNLVTVNASSHPSSDFPALVGAFDSLNRKLRLTGVNVKDGVVSPLAAAIMIRHFGPLQDVPEAEVKTNAEVIESQPYFEPSDQEFSAWLEEAQSTEPVKDIVDVPTGESNGSVSHVAARDSGPSL